MIRLLVALSFAPLIVGSTTLGQTPGPDWMRGSGLDLEIRVTGKVVDSEGKALDADTANSLDFSVERSRNGARSILRSEYEAGEFSVWIPVYEEPFYSLKLRAVCRAGDHIAIRSLRHQDLHDAAKSGVTLKLQPRGRKVTVEVIDQGKPVPGAEVHALMVDTSIPGDYQLQAVSDDRGIATFQMTDTAKLVKLTATSNSSIGGYTTYRTESLDGSESHFYCGLVPARSQTFQFVDESGDPVEGIDFELILAIADHSYLGEIPENQMTTANDGTAVHPLFPNRDTVHCYIEISDPNWYTVGDLRWDGEIAKQIVARMPKRVTVRGKIDGSHLPDGLNLAGRTVQHYSTQHPQGYQFERLFSFLEADGSFVSRVLPDSTYLTFLEDTEAISESVPWSTKPNDAGGMVAPETLAKIATEPGILTTVQVVTGQKKKAVANANVSFQSDRRFKFFDEQIGRSRSAVTGRGVSKRTDSRGLATMLVPAGETTVQRYIDGERVEKTFTAGPKMPGTITLHHKPPTKPGSTYRLTGKVIAGEGSDFSIDNISIEVASVMGLQLRQLATTTNSEGKFEVDNVSQTVAVLAKTPDGRGYAGRFCDLDGKPIQLELKSSMAFEGQLLSPEGLPVADRPVKATVKLESTRRGPSGFSLTAFIGSWQTKPTRMECSDSSRFRVNCRFL